MRIRLQEFILLPAGTREGETAQNFLFLEVATQNRSGFPHTLMLAFIKC